MTFDPLTLAVLLVAFAWSGFLRTAFGFGASALMLPIALLVVDNPIIVIPVVVAQTIALSGFEAVRHHKKVAWHEFALLYGLGLPAFIAGIYGLINLPDKILTLGVYAITIGYAISYLAALKPFHSRLLDFVTFSVGSYFNGLSFNGGPLVVAVIAKYIKKTRLRETLFVLWTINGILKLSMLAAAGVDLQLTLQLLAIPAVLIGHIVGHYAHGHIVRDARFYRYLGGVLLLVSTIGIVKTFGVAAVG